MTSPLAGGGQTFTLTPGQAVLLTEYAAGPDSPLTIINTGSATVYVAELSSVNTANSVPLQGGTSLPWTQPGQVWAMLDPAATSSGTLVITGAVSDWQPSPEAIASATAAQLLANGVPNVLTTKQLADQRTLTTVTYDDWDVSGFASVTFYGQPGMFALTWLPAVGVNSLGGYTALPGNGSVSELPVIAPRLRVAYIGATSAPYSLWASNRTARQPGANSRNLGSGGDLWSIAAGTTFAGTMAFQQQGVGVHVQGQVMAAFFLSGTTIAGSFRVNTTNAGNVNVCNSSEMVATASGNRSLIRMIGLGSSPYSFDFVTGTGGVGNASVQLIAAN